MRLFDMSAVGRNRAAAHVAFLCMLLFVPLTLARAQGVGSTRGLPTTTGGNNTIQGKVIFPDSPGGANRRVKVTLESAELMTNQNTVTDDDGSFRFNQLPAGPYTIVVEAGKEYQDAREQITLEGATQIASIPIYLRLKPENNPALSGVPRGAVDLYTKALDSAKTGKGKKAVEQLEGAIALYPNFAAALAELGLQYLKLGQPEKAAEALHKATDLAPNDFLARLNYGIALYGSKKYAEAEPQLRQALKMNDASPTGHMYLGMTLLTLSRNQQTKQFDAEKYAEAQKELEAAARSGSDQVALAHRYLGGIYMGNKDNKRAADELEMYLKLAPKAPDAEKIRAMVKDLRSKG